MAFAVIEFVITWFIKGRGLWSFYKDFKNWKKGKEAQVVKIEDIKKKKKRMSSRPSHSVGLHRRGSSIKKRSV